MNIINVLNIQINFGRLEGWANTFVQGAITTLALSLIAVVIGILIALLLTIMRRSKYKLISGLSKFYVLVVRGTPMILQLMIWLYALPYLGIRIPEIPLFGDVYGSREFLTAVIALGLNSGAYVSEIFRSGLESVDVGQAEASRSLGMSKRRTMQKIILPQALKTVMPSLGNEFISMIKESSIVSVVGVFDLMYTYTIIKSSTYTVFEPLIIVGIIYLFLTTVLTFALNRVERSFDVTNKNKPA